MQGRQLQVPGEIFQQQESFSAEVKGWNSKRTDQLVVKFDDGTQVRLLQHAAHAQDNLFVAQMGLMPTAMLASASWSCFSD
jgi:hypothetical protein